MAKAKPTREYGGLTYHHHLFVSTKREAQAEADRLRATRYSWGRWGARIEKVAGGYVVFTRQLRKDGR